jgi:protein-export membrane protein SecD
MSDDLEPRLRSAFRHGTLPAAPASLVDTLERVPNAPVTARRRGGGRSIWTPLAVAAVLVVAGAVAITGGQRGIVPGPTPPASVQPSVAVASAAASAAITGTLRIEYRAQQVGDVKPIAGDMDAIAAIVERRLATVGATGATVRVEGDDGLVVELPASADPDALRKFIGQTGRVDFVPLGTTQKEVGDTIDAHQFPALFSGDQLESASIGNDPTRGRLISFVLRPDGARLFADYTAANIGKYFAIVLDSKVISAPVINSAIPGGEVEISKGGIGGYELDEATQLVAVLNSGVLPYPLVEVSNEIVSPSP